MNTETRTYIVQDSDSHERTGNEEKCEAISARWCSARKPSPYSCGNLASEIVRNRFNGEWENETPAQRFNTFGDAATHDHLYSCLSSPMLLYRCCALFGFVPQITKGGYKVLWEMSVEHIATGEVVSFSEWKGSPSFRTRFKTTKDAPADFIADLKEVLAFLVGNEIPHPYDSTVAGFQA